MMIRSMIALLLLLIYSWQASALWQQGDIVDVWQITDSGRVYVGPATLYSDKNRSLDFGNNTRPLSWARAFCMGESGLCVRTSSELLAPSLRPEFSDFLSLDYFVADSKLKYKSQTQRVSDSQHERVFDIQFDRPISNQIRIAIRPTEKQMNSVSSTNEKPDSKPSFDSIRERVLSLGWFEDKKFIQAGTGFVVGDGNFIFTNHHVISRYPECVMTLICTMGVVAEKSSGEFSSVQIKVQVIQSQLNLDFAVLKRLDSDQRFRVPLTIAQRAIGSALAQNNELFVWGYPLFGNYRPVEARGRIVFPARSNFRAGINSIDLPIVYQTDLNIGPGHSGSPVMNEDLAVVGYVSMGRNMGLPSDESNQKTLKGIVFSFDDYLKSVSTNSLPSVEGELKIRQNNRSENPVVYSKLLERIERFKLSARFTASQVLWDQVLSLPTRKEREEAYLHLRGSMMLRISRTAPPADRPPSNGRASSQTTSGALMPRRMYMVKIGQKRKQYHLVSLISKPGFLEIDSQAAPIFNLICIPVQKSQQCSLKFKGAEASQKLKEIFGLSQNLNSLRAITRFVSSKSNDLSIRIELNDTQSRDSVISFTAVITPSIIQLKNQVPVTSTPPEAATALKVRGLRGFFELMPFGDYWLVSSQKLNEISPHCMSSFCSLEVVKDRSRTMVETFPFYKQRDFAVVRLVTGTGELKPSSTETWAKSTADEYYQITDAAMDLPDVSLRDGAIYYRKSKSQSVWSDAEASGARTTADSAGRPTSNVPTSSPWRLLKDKAGVRAICLETEADVLCLNSKIWNEIYALSAGGGSDLELAFQTLSVHSDLKKVQQALLDIEEGFVPKPYGLVPLMLKSQSLEKRRAIMQSLVRQGVVRAVE